MCLPCICILWIWWCEAWHGLETRQYSDPHCSCPLLAGAPELTWLGACTNNNNAMLVLPWLQCHVCLFAKRTDVIGRLHSWFESLSFLCCFNIESRLAWRCEQAHYAIAAHAALHIWAHDTCLLSSRLLCTALLTYTTNSQLISRTTALTEFSAPIAQLEGTLTWHLCFVQGQLKLQLKGWSYGNVWGESEVSELHIGDRWDL